MPSYQPREKRDESSERARGKAMSPDKSKDISSQASERVSIYKSETAAGLNSECSISLRIHALTRIINICMMMKIRSQRSSTKYVFSCAR